MNGNRNNHRGGPQNILAGGPGMLQPGVALPSPQEMAQAAMAQELQKMEAYSSVFLQAVGVFAQKADFLIGDDESRAQQIADQAEALAKETFRRLKIDISALQAKYANFLTCPRPAEQQAGTVPNESK